MRKSTLTAFIVLLLCVGSAWAQTARRKIIIDQDTFGSGGPNNEAILLALQAPNVDVLGITVESGDGWQDENLAHVLRMLELVKRTDVPVYRGSTYPLVNSMARTKRWEGLYGAIPYKGAWQETWPEYNSVDPHAVPWAHCGASAGGGHADAEAGGGFCRGFYDPHGAQVSGTGDDHGTGAADEHCAGGAAGR